MGKQGERGIISIFISLMSILIIFFIFQKWVEIMAYIGGGKYSVFNVATFVDENPFFVRNLLWKEYGESANDKFVSYAKAFATGGYLVVILEGMYFLLVTFWGKIIPEKTMCYMGHITAGIGSVVSLAFLFTLFRFNVFLENKYEDASFNSIFVFQAAPFFVLALSLLQNFLIKIKYRKTVCVSNFENEFDNRNASYTGYSNFIRCPFCGGNIPADGLFCPHCGMKINR